MRASAPDFDGMFGDDHDREADLRSVRSLLALIREHVAAAGEVELYGVGERRSNGRCGAARHAVLTDRLPGLIVRRPRVAGRWLNMGAIEPAPASGRIKRIMMTVRHSYRWQLAVAGGVLATVLGLGPGIGAVMAQQHGTADLAARLTGTWRLNKELSPDLANRGRGGEGRRGGGPSFAVVSVAAQRGGRGGGGGGAPGVEMPGMTSAEAAAQAALAMIQQVPFELTIAATPAEVRIVEPRGESLFRVDGKTASVEVPGGTIKVRSRWDGNALRQEFSSAQRMLRRSWTIDASNRLVLTQRIESLTFNSKDARAVFDRE